MDCMASIDITPLLMLRYVQIPQSVNIKDALESVAGGRGRYCAHSTKMFAQCIYTTTTTVMT